MVSLKYNSFANNLYVNLSLVISVTEAILLFVIMIFMTDFQDLAIKIFFSCVVGIMIFLSFYINAPMAFFRIQLTDTGIGFGKQNIAYKDIQTISIAKARVSTWFGFRFLEDCLGVPQHFDSYYGEVICVNCNFSDFKAKKGQSKIYLPKNKRTVALMKQYCTKFNQALESYNSVKCDIPQISKYKCIFCVLSSCAAFILAAVVFVLPLLQYQKIVVATTLFAFLEILIWRYA